MSKKTPCPPIIEHIGPYSFTQPINGQRITTDTLCLLDFMLPLVKPEDTVIDLGTGAGVMPLMLAARTASKHIVGIEIDSQASALAAKSVATNKLEEIITIINADFRKAVDTFDEGSFSVVVSNPPYRKAGAGRQSHDKARETGRAETATLKELLSVSRHLAGNSGKVFFVFPVSRLFEMLRDGKMAGLTPRRLRFVHTKEDKAAKFFLIEFGRSGGLIIEEPVIL